MVRLQTVIAITLLSCGPTQARAQRVGPEKVVARIEQLGGSAIMHLENAWGPGPSKQTNRVESVNLSGNLTGDKLNVRDLRLVGTLSPLVNLHLSWTPTTDEGVLQLHRLTNLRRLSLEDTQITDRALGALSRMHRMESLFLGETQITSAGLKYLAGMSQLKELYLGDTYVRNLSALTHFPLLEKLNLSGTQVGDDDLRHLAKLPKLKWLMLNDTHITNHGLINVLRCRQLSTLTMRRTWVTAEAAEAVQRFLPNCKIKHSRK